MILRGNRQAGLIERVNQASEWSIGMRRVQFANGLSVLRPIVADPDRTVSVADLEKPAQFGFDVKLPLRAKTFSSGPAGGLKRRSSAAGELLRVRAVRDLPQQLRQKRIDLAESQGPRLSARFPS